MSAQPAGELVAGAVELAAAVAARKLSARELAAGYLARIGSSAESLNAVVVIDAERALTAAAAVDEAVAAGVALGPLAGVPVTVKEAFAVEGTPATAGMAEHAARVSAADAPAVAALRGAGAVVLGKTNVPTQLADLQSANPLYGRTSNPWDTDRSCGGSSGGSAVAMSASLSALELGSDLSGSIRVPASWCGVYGLRPSNGWISKRDHLPWPLGGLLEPPTSVVGPMARSVADLALAFEVLAAGAPPAFAGTPVGGSTRPVPALESLRVGLWAPGPEAPVDADTSAVLSRTATALEAAGVAVEEFAVPGDAGEALALGWRLVQAEITHGLTAEQWDMAVAAPTGPMTQLVRPHLADQERRLQLGTVWDRALAGLDAVLCPATAVAAQPHDPRPRLERPTLLDGTAHHPDVLPAWSVLASVAQQPAVTLPAGAGPASGLPVGVQLLGSRHGDRRLLEVAAMLDEVIGGWRPPPAWC